MPDLALPRCLRPRRTAVAAALALATCGATLTTPDALGAVDTTHITGVVTSTAGEPLAGITVTPWEKVGENSWAGRTPASTGNDGAYDLAGLTPGTYAVQVSDPAGYHVTELWQDARYVSDATLVVLSAGGRVSGVSPMMDDAGRVLGSVVAPMGSPVTNVYAAAESITPGVSLGAGSLVRSDGTFAIGGLPSGPYRIRFADFTGQLATEYYDDAPTQASATPISVTAGSDTTGITAAMAPASHITGTLTGAGGVAAGGVNVTAYRRDEASGGFAYAASISTDTSGAYRLNVPTGDYRLAFDDYQHRYLPEYWDDEPSLAEADDVTVGAAQTVAGVDAELGSGSYITGTITGRPGVSTSQVLIVASPNGSGGTTAYSYVRPDGTYSVGPLTPGDYTVSFQDGAHNYVPQYWQGARVFYRATPVAVSSSGSVDGIDAVLKVASHITGRLTDTRAKPVAGVIVTAYDDRGRQATVYTETGPDGGYDVGGPSRGTYRLSFRDVSREHLGEYWDDQPTLETADRIPLGPQTVVAGKDARLADSARISGVVRGPDGSRLAGISVSAQRDGPPYSAPGGYGYAVTDTEGRYTVSGLRNGRFTLEFTDSSGRVLDQFWRDAPTRDTADRIVVAPRSAVLGKNVRLRESSHITGTVLAGGGEPLASAYVSAYAYDERDGYWDYVSSSSVDASGHYDIGRLPAAGYRLRFSRYGYATEFWRDQVTLDQGDEVAVGRQAVVTGKNAELATEGRITGLVTDADGNPVPNLSTVAFTWSTDEHGWVYFTGDSTDADGRYELSGLPTNTYRVGFLPLSDDKQQPFATQFWNARADVSTADDVAVVAGRTAAGVDATLAEESVISGRLTDAAGDGVGGYVRVFRQNVRGRYVPYGYGDHPVRPQHHRPVSGGQPAAGQLPAAIRALAPRPRARVLRRCLHARGGHRHRGVEVGPEDRPP